jgi:hypothetical protein
MANTANFGWETPDDTDLVKDGAASIRTLGSAIDTSMVDLKGGTSGQILSKNSNTDMDFVWITNDVGDITAVTAGTGISGGGTTGAVTITNSMATTIDAKGDLIVGTGADTFARLAVGTNGHTLVADSAETTGLKWQAPTTATFTGCLAASVTLQSINNATYTAVALPEPDVYDTDSFHNPSSNNSRITIPSGKGGYYLVWGCVAFKDNATGERQVRVAKNGTALGGAEGLVPTSINNAGGGNPAAVYFTTILNLAAADYIEMFARQYSGGALNLENAIFGCQKVG